MSDVNNGGAPALPTMLASLCVDRAAEAIEFYRQAFGAREVLARITDGQGRVGHAELQIGDTVFYLCDEHPEIDILGPHSRGGSPVPFVLHVGDVDARVAAALAAGAKLVRPGADQFYGDRTGMVRDPFGFHWLVSTHVEDISEAELLRRAAELERRGAGG